MIQRQTLTDLGVTGARADKYLDDLNRLLPEHDIDTPLRAAHFLAQVLHESGHLRHVREGMSYSSAERLLAVFGRHISAAEAPSFVRQPEKVGNRVYANRMGNGDEASGDGFRYRGRGLIQLTGKNNYRDFDDWGAPGVVEDPERVADEHAVLSAIFFWSRNLLNQLADLDDVKKLTRRINGGLNGLADRMDILKKAKTALAVPAQNEATRLERVSHRVSASALNLRSRPKVASTTRIGTLAQGTEVLKIADAEVAGWVKVRVVHLGRVVEGFVAGRHLEAVAVPAHGALARGVQARAAATTPAVTIPAVHLDEDRREIQRGLEGRRAHPLGEKGRPQVRGRRPGTRARQLVEIVEYLDCENPDHQRYQRQGRVTFSNVYVYDYCYLAGSYLPRVWWTAESVRQIAGGARVAPEYGTSVRELTTNDLYDWLADHGADHGWESTTHLDVLQAAANIGETCLIVAQRRARDFPGRIAAVVPEHGDQRAVRDRRDEVLRPLQSLAWHTNHRFTNRRSAWWQNPRYDAFSFWRHP